MTSISSYKFYECAKCRQGHIEPIYKTINFKYPPPTNKKLSDLLVCQKCSTGLLLSEFKYLGIKEKPRRNYTTWESMVRKIKGIKLDPSPVDLYPFLSRKPLDLVSEVEGFQRLGMRPEQYPNWFKELTSTLKSEDGNVF